jgi:hypothetical protein
MAAYDTAFDREVKGGPSVAEIIAGFSMMQVIMGHGLRRSPRAKNNYSCGL